MSNTESLESQVNRLSVVLKAEITGFPLRGESTVDFAIRMLRRGEKAEAALTWIEQHYEEWAKNPPPGPNPPGIVLVARALSECAP